MRLAVGRRLCLSRRPLTYAGVVNDPRLKFAGVLQRNPFARVFYAPTGLLRRLITCPVWVSLPASRHAVQSEAKDLKSTFTVNVKL